MTDEVRFRKSGAAIKAAAHGKMEQIEARLKRRHEALNEFMGDLSLVRSYLVRSSKSGYGMHGRGSLWSETDISSEKMEEIRQLCERIYDLEAEWRRLKLVVVHLADEQTFDLTYDELLGYGFVAP